MEIRDHLFNEIGNTTFRFSVFSNQEGVLAGINDAKEVAANLGVEFRYVAIDGGRVQKNDCVMEAYGNPYQIANIEEKIPGLIGKPSGIASAAARSVALSEGKLNVVCGAWKKIDYRLKDSFRNAILLGGAGIRICDTSFIYLDKNYITMLGGISNAIIKAKTINGHKVVIQLHSLHGSIEEEAEAAIAASADILMIDTGDRSDIIKVIDILVNEGIRQYYKVAFAGNIMLEDIPTFIDSGVDILDIGRSIIDAPMLDFYLNVEEKTG